MRVVPLTGHSESATPDLPGTIGKYRIIEVVGRGAMGVVYRARDPEIGRDVALKLMRSLPSENPQEAAEGFKRFRLEARSAGALRHPNIVTVFDMSHDGDRPYIVMEFIAGEGLERILQRERCLSLARTIGLIRQIGAALDHAHARGVVHRDIKPSNILISPDDHVSILDFGVAGMMRRPRGVLDERDHVREEIVGTPAYMSPEQIKGGLITGVSDLFSLAALTFECLTGHIPFPGDTATSLMRNIRDGKRRRLTDVAPHVSPSLEAVFARALASDPSERYPDAAAFVTALEETHRRAEAPEDAGPLSFARKGPRPSALTELVAVIPASNAAIVGNTAWQAHARSIEDHDQFAPRQVHPQPRVTPGSIFAGGEPPIIRRVVAHRAAQAQAPTYRRDPRFLAALFIGCLFVPLTAFVVWSWLAPLLTPRHEPRTVSLAIASTAAPGDTLEMPLIESADPNAPIQTLNNRQILGVLTRGDESEVRLLEALAVAGQRRIPGFVDASIFPLRHSASSVRLATIKLLGATGDRRIVLELAGALQDNDSLIRASAARALAQLGDRRAVPLLLNRYTTEPETDVRAALKRAYEQVSGLPFHAPTEMPS